MKFAKFMSPTGKPVWMNKDGFVIRATLKGDRAGNTTISAMCSDMAISVMETPEEVVKLFEWMND